MSKKCAICGDTLRFRLLAGRCPYCGGTECWVSTRWHATVCARFVDGDLYVDLSPRRCAAIVCGPCDESFARHSDALLVSPGPIRFDVQKEVLLDLDGRYYGLPDETKTVIREIARGTVWRSSDSCRGHSSPPSAAGEYVRVLDGWHSSMERSPFTESLERLLREGNGLTRPLVAVLARTSNVCTTGISLFVHRRDVEAVKAALDMRTGGVGDVSLDR